MTSRLLNIYRFYFWPAEKYARYRGVKIGKNCSFASKNFGSEPYLIEVGDNVQVTKGVSFFNHGGAWVFRRKHPKLDFFGKIKIGNNVYIGANTMIMPGVTIGSDVIIGAGSVVTKSVPNGNIVAGNPCRIIGRIDDLERRVLEFDVGTKGLDFKSKKNVLLSLSDDCFIKK
jgi:acetyltransferase-like isoleucine patch superfamily enzyme